MKKTILFIILSILLLSSMTVKASHIAASDISYRCLGGNNYEITLRLFRDCQGISIPPTIPVQIQGTGTCDSFSISQSLNLVSQQEIPISCALLSSQSTCNGGSQFGVEKYVYTGVVNLSTLRINCGWKVSYSSCCRNGTITNLATRFSAVYLETEYIGNTGIFCNNSPTVSSTPVFMVCDGVLQNISSTMLDPDGDSLVYQLVAPLDNATTPIAYNSGLSATAPLNTLNGYQFDPLTGQSSFIPIGAQGTVADVLTSEYRNGILIGRARRTTQIIVINCAGNSGPNLQLVSRNVNGTWFPQGTNTTFEACAGEPLHFSLSFVDSNATDSIKLSDTYSSLSATYPGATFTTTYSGLLANQATIEVVIPSINFNNFTIGVFDNACPVASVQTFGIQIIPAAGCAQLEGVAFLDANNSCTQDTSEAPYATYSLRLTRGSNIITIAPNGLGDYSAYLDTGTYQVEVVTASPYYELCTSIQSVTIPAGGGAVTLDLPIQISAYCPYMTVSIGAPVLVHCNHNVYYVSYCNNGTIDANNAYINVLLDSLFLVDSTSHPIDSQAVGFYRFDLGTVPVGACGNIRIYGQLDSSCNTNLVGQTYCASAQIFPDTICGLWNGASLTIEGICTGDSILFRVHNEGTQAMTIPQTYTVIEDNIILQNGPSLTLAAGAHSTWFSYFADGSTLRAEIKQAPNYPWSNKASATITGCVSPLVGGLPVTGMTNLFSLNDGLPSVSIDCQESVASYDPNDKQGFPTGYGPDHYIKKNTDLEYRIRFQNTGTYFATDIVIRDTLSPHLNAFSAQPTLSSHNYTWKVLDNHVLEFTFNNINLPDSGHNLAGSQGFIDFRVKQEANLPIGTVINNTAAIYFDRNPAIITNTTFHTIGENFIVLTDLPALASEDKDVRVTAFPNPFQQSITIRIKGLLTYKNLRLEVYNAMGQLVQQVNNQGNTQEVVLSRNGLASGVYFYRLIADNTLLHSGRLLAQ